MGEGDTNISYLIEWELRYREIKWLDKTRTDKKSTEELGIEPRSQKSQSQKASGNTKQTESCHKEVAWISSGIEVATANIVGIMLPSHHHYL